MEGLCHPLPKTINTQIQKLKAIQHIPLTDRKSLQCHFSKYEEPSPRRNDLLKHSKRGCKVQLKPTRRLITISTADSGYKGQWTCDYVLTLGELQLTDLADEVQRDAEVFVGLDIQKHAGFGYSIDGKIISSFTRKCSNCFSKYVKEIDTTFNVWVLPSSRGSHSMPEIGGDDPSVIYVKPGAEADLDSLIRDTIRLYTSVKDTCSEACCKSVPAPQFIGKKETYFDKRWARLLEFKRAMARETLSL